MKSTLKKNLYWVGVAVGNVLGMMGLAFLFMLALGLPNTMLSGLFAWAFVLLVYIFAADDDQRDALKKLVGK